MNQRRRPMGPLSGPQRPQPKPQPKPGHFWPYYDPYYVWDDYYDWDDWHYDWDDWDHYYGARPARAPMPPKPEPTPKPKVVQFLKLSPLLMVNLLEYAYKEAQSESELQDMVSNMLTISANSWGSELTISDYEKIISTGSYTSAPTPPKPTPPTPKE